jgi:hypothetical protein
LPGERDGDAAGGVEWFVGWDIRGDVQSTNGNKLRW